MKLYLAGAESWSRVFADVVGGHRVLLSYWYIQDAPHFIDYYVSRDIPVFLDSGAFSAKNKGVEIKINDYIDFIHTHHGMVDVISNLDVIGNPTESERNHQTLLESGIDALPVYHVGSPWSVLVDLFERFNYVGLGGMAGFGAKRKALGAWLARVFKIRRGVNPTCKIHGFGLTTWELIANFPFTSVDSTSWINVSIHNEFMIHTRAGLRRARSRQEFIDLLPFLLTRPDDVNDVMLPPKTDAQSYVPLFRYNLQCWTDAIKRIPPT